MRKTTFGAIALAMTLAAGLAGSANAQKIDANGKCHAANGEFAKAEVCSGVKADAKADTKAAKAEAKADKTKASATDTATKADAKAAKTKTDAKADATKAKTDAKADAKVAKVKCKNAKGKFAKCGTAGATPVT
jgi:hypothetical protein